MARELFAARATHLAPSLDTCLTVGTPAPVVWRRGMEDHNVIHPLPEWSAQAAHAKRAVVADLVRVASKLIVSFLKRLADAG